MTKAVAKQEGGQVADYGSSLLEVIAKAARDPGVDVDKMERLFAMQERVEARAAEVAFAEAFAAMQPNLPHITVKNKIVHNGRVISEYADWPSISKAITPILSEYGFSLNFGGSNTADEKTTEARLRHRAGHVETNSITLPHDTSGAKNKVQAIGSSSTYGQRYSACPLVGVVVHGDDDDGRAAGGNAAVELADDVRVKIIQLCEAVGDNQADKIIAAYRVGSIADLNKEQAHSVIERLEGKLAEKAKAATDAKAQADD